MNYFVYAYLDPLVNCNIITDDCTFINLPFYIGYGSGTRHLSHLQTVMRGEIDKNNPLKSRKIKKILDVGVVPSIIKIKEFLSKNDAKNLERSLIKQIGTRVKIYDHPKGPLTNLREGGTGGLSEEAKKKISISRMGKLLSAETKAKVSVSVTIALQDPVRRKKISDTHKGKSKSESHATKLRQNLQKFTNTPEQRQRAKTRMTGRIVSDEERKKIAIGVAAFVSKTIWINNGSVSKRILKNESIPNGWNRGRGKVKF
jgi:hypothetical protein